MKKWQVFRYRQDSAQFVIAHARLQQSRGRNPSVAFKGVNNPRKALCLAEKTLQQQKEAEERRVAEVANQALALKKEWRFETNKKNMPSANFTVTHATDLVAVTGLFELFINHVNSFDGEGFRAVLKHARSSVQSGEVHLGTGPEAFDKALSEGQRILRKGIDQLNAETERMNQLEIRCHSRRRTKK